MFIINTIIISIIIIATFKHPRKTCKGVIYHVDVSCYSLPVNQTGLAPNWQNDMILSCLLSLSGSTNYCVISGVSISSRSNFNHVFQTGELADEPGRNQEEVAEASQQHEGKAVKLR